MKILGELQNAARLPTYDRRGRQPELMRDSGVIALCQHAYLVTVCQLYDIVIENTLCKII